MNSAGLITPARTSSENFQTSVPADRPALEAPVQHRPTGNDDCRQVAGGSAHDQGWRGLVAAGHQHDAIDRVAADRLLHIHGGEIAKEHGGGAQIGLAAGKHRKLQRQAARLQHARLDVFDQAAKVGVAGREFGEGVADADHRTPVEGVIRQAIVFHPAAMDEAILVEPSEPMLRSQFSRHVHPSDVRPTPCGVSRFYFSYNRSYLRSSVKPRDKPACSPVRKAGAAIEKLNGEAE